MTKSPGTHVEPLAAAAKHGGRLLPLSPYRHPPECPGRANCLPGLKRAAGKSVALLALAAGYIDVTLRFTTDPGITAWHLAVLADDRGLQLAGNVTPLVRRDVIVGYGPNLVAVLNKAPALLDAGTLRAADTRVQLAMRKSPAGGRRLAARTGLIPAGVTRVE